MHFLTKFFLFIVMYYIIKGVLKKLMAPKDHPSSFQTKKRNNDNIVEAEYEVIDDD